MFGGAGQASHRIEIVHLQQQAAVDGLERPVRRMRWPARIGVGRKGLAALAFLVIADDQVAGEEDVVVFEEEGEVVGIFPEGRLTTDGAVGPFKTGIEQIIKRTPAPVVPMALRGLWGSFFSRRYGKVMGAFPRRFWSRVELAVDEPVPAEQATSTLLRERVVALRGDWP